MPRSPMGMPSGATCRCRTGRSRAEQVVAGVTAGDLAQRVLGVAQFLGGGFAGAGGGEYVGGAVEVVAHGFEGEHMAAACAEGAFAAAGAGQLLEVLAQGVEALAGFRRGPQPGRAVAFLTARDATGEVDLVDQHHAFGTGGQVGEEAEVGVDVLLIGDQQRGVGVGEFAVGAAHAFALDFVVGVAQAGGVGQFQRDAVQAQGFAQHVAGGAGDRRDDGAVAAGQRVEQAGLAGVGAAHDGHLEAIVEAQAALRLAQQLGQFRAQAVELLRDGGIGEEVDFLLRKIDRRLDVHAQRDQRLQQRLDLARTRLPSTAARRARRRASGRRSGRRRLRPGPDRACR
ncbi:hypothetical protein RLIN73S_06090 [Rhodanobacter lindaniclasticus]